MIKKIEETRYGKDILSVGIVTAMMLNSFSFDLLIAIIVGITISFIPRALLIWRKADLKDKSEKMRAAIMFCIYLFLTIWSTDLGNSNQTKFIAVTLMSAAFYNLILWFIYEGIARRAEKARMVEANSERVLKNI